MCQPLDFDFTIIDPKTIEQNNFVYHKELNYPSDLITLSFLD